MIIFMVQSKDDFTKNGFHYLQPGSPSASPNKRFISPRRDEEERRQILKMLVTPQNSANTKRTLSSVSFDNMVIKAARSAENLQEQSSGSNFEQDQKNIIKTAFFTVSNNQLVSSSY
jgi:hypothetical protein